MTAKHSHMSFISVLKQCPEQQHAKERCPCLDKRNAIATLLLDQASDIVRRLYTALNIGKRLNALFRSHTV